MSGRGAKKIFGMFAAAALAMLFTLSGKSFAAQPLWLAHRGDSAEADESTMKAYRLAASYNVDYLECDPRLTRDGAFITMHDPTIDRTTNGKGKVAELALAEIKKFHTRQNEQAPTIEEILVFARSEGIGVYLDTKERGPEYFAKLIELVGRCNMADRVIVGVWDLQSLEWMHKNHPEIQVCVSWPWPAQSLKQAKAHGATWVGTLVPLASRRMIANAHRAGIKVVTLQINDLETIREKISFGINMVQTDDSRLKQEIDKP